MPDASNIIARAPDIYTVSTAQAREFGGASHIVSTGPFDVLVMKDGRRIPLDVPICGCCDAVLTDGFCRECN